MIAAREETLRAALATTCAKAGLDPDTALADLVGPEVNVEDFWHTVTENLRAGRLRLVFVADDVPPELRRIVEFLNEHMDPTEVLAVEVRQYVGAGVKALVPSVVGRTMRAEARKPAPARQWDAGSFLGDLRRRGDEVAAGVVEALLAWAAGQRLELRWGQGAKHGGVGFVVARPEGGCEAISLWDSGKNVQLSINVGRLGQHMTVFYRADQPPPPELLPPTSSTALPPASAASPRSEPPSPTVRPAEDFDVLPPPPRR